MRAIVLAGGRGTRLAPYTTVLPKPLMPLHDMPILEVVVRQLRAHGCERVTCAVGHLAGLIEAFFGDGARFGLPIDYSREDAPLGTAGPIALVGGLTSSFLVMNGDLLTTLSYRDMLAQHRAHGGIATVGVHQREIKVDLGVIETTAAGRISGYVEKPTLRYQASMGIYVFEPAVLDFIPRGQRFDLPDLVLKLVAAGEAVHAYRHDGTWLDIGRMDDYERAVALFEQRRGEFLPSP